MKNIKKSDFSKFREVNEYISELLRKAAKLFVESGLTNCVASWHLDKHEIGENEIDCVVYESWAYGGEDWHNFSIPVDYLFDQFWEKKWVELLEYQVSEKEYAERQHAEQEKLTEIKKSQETLKKHGVK